MMKKASAWVIGIGCGERKYKLNNVTYTVSSSFEPVKSKNTLKERFERTFISDFVPLTIVDTKNKMADEYVCSAAGEEDNHAVEKEN